MFVKVHQPLATTKGNNKGSSSNLIDYLSKEDKATNLMERTGFFNIEHSKISADSSTALIDGNNKNLGKDDFKFYMVSINPSAKEQQHLSAEKPVAQMNASEKNSYEEKLMGFTHRAMDQYAKSFNKDIKATDLVYVAKIEHSRTFKGNDKDVLNGAFKSGEQKPGMQSHIHIVVSRNNKEQDKKLSPLSKFRPANECEIACRASVHLI